MQDWEKKVEGAMQEGVRDSACRPELEPVWVDARRAEAQQEGAPPRLTSQDIDDAIHLQAYYVFPGATVTVCCLTLRNGFSVLGQSACVSQDGFDAELGRRLAFKDAREKVWQLEGYLLKERLYQATKIHLPKDSERYL